MIKDMHIVPRVAPAPEMVRSLAQSAGRQTPDDATHVIIPVTEAFLNFVEASQVHTDFYAIARLFRRCTGAEAGYENPRYRDVVCDFTQHWALVSINNKAAGFSKQVATNMASQIEGWDTLENFQKIRGWVVYSPESGRKTSEDTYEHIRLFTERLGFASHKSTELVRIPELDDVPIEQWSEPSKFKYRPNLTSLGAPLTSTPGGVNLQLEALAREVQQLRAQATAQNYQGAPVQVTVPQIPKASDEVQQLPAITIEVDESIENIELYKHTPPPPLPQSGDGVKVVSDVDDLNPSVDADVPTQVKPKAKAKKKAGRPKKTGT